MLGEKMRRRIGNVLEFEGDDAAVARKFLQRALVAVLGPRRGGSDIESAGFRLVGINMCLEAKARCRKSEHAAELAAADNADSCPGCEGRKRGRVRHGLERFFFLGASSGDSATASV